ncbi:M15 family metallopeptidase [Methylocystis sp. WRRC1]|uniref:M15 family metallopeptidase n=1 Tax=unclassified Methylocystis TaxID=2625913 RepID=UPI0001F86854|nr:MULTISPECIES: M15 family metallopeptidase [unclassified Methylocystis]MCC3246162.1 M15 family metallopeptidase [Methylocystis sp. WRRC1]
MPMDTRSESRLNGVHADLAKVVRRCAKDSKIEFIVTEGRRTMERQKALVAAGASKTLKSRHLTGHAIDLAVKVGGKVRWDWPLYARLAADMKKAAAAVGVPIEWGGDWRSLKDGPHFQLPWAKYPA